MAVDPTFFARHPIVAASVEIGDRLKTVADVDPMFMTRGETAAALLQFAA
jgi:hypothetical protein